MMNAAAKGAYLSAKSLAAYTLKKTQRITNNKQEQASSDGESDEGVRSLCSVNSDDLDGNLNLSENEEEA